MPGSNARALEKAKRCRPTASSWIWRIPSPPDAKAAARDQVAAAVAAGVSAGGKSSCGSMASTPRGGSTISAWRRRRSRDGVLVPKVASVADLTAIANRFGDIGADHAIRVWIMIETPLGVLRVEELAAAARDSEMRLAGLVIGPNDIARETRMRMVPGRAPMVPALMQCMFAARAYGLDILDGVYNNFSDTEGFARECAQAREMGFDGKTLIHPSQIEPCNAAFTPAGRRCRSRSREILAEFAKPENDGRGAIQIRGQMVERLHMERRSARWRSPMRSRR